MRFDPEKMRRCRMLVALSQRELAEQMGIARKSIWSWENGEHVPNPRNIRRLALALEVKPKDLLSEDDE